VQDETEAKLDATSTLLTQGHHRRLFQFLSELNTDSDSHRSNLDPTRLKEFRKLCALLEEERKLYSKALHQFREVHMNRFLLGFSGMLNIEKFPVYFHYYLIHNIVQYRV
jgi:hypothetical protein